MKKMFVSFFAFVGAMFATSAALAEEPGGDLVGGTITAIEGVGTDLTTVGAAIIAVAVIVFAFRWIKAAFF